MIVLLCIIARHIQQRVQASPSSCGVVREVEADIVDNECGTVVGIEKIAWQSEPPKRHC